MSKANFSSARALKEGTWVPCLTRTVIGQPQRATCIYLQRALLRVLVHHLGQHDGQLRQRRACGPLKRLQNREMRGRSVPTHTSVAVSNSWSW